MSVTVKVQQAIEFISAGRAGRWKNVLGPMKEQKKHFRDDFLQDSFRTAEWTATAPGAGSVAISEIAAGAVLITTGATPDSQSDHFATAIIWNGTQNAMFEARISITDVSDTGVFVGFTDAKSETDAIAIGYPSDVLTTTASTAVGFVIDADHATSSIMLASVNGDSDGTPVDTGVDWADGETRDLRVALDTSGNATFYINGAVVGRIASAVTASTLLCFSVDAITRVAADTVTVRRVDIWCDEV